jgi:hypothetical protein
LVAATRFGICRGYVVTADGEETGDDIIIFNQERFGTLTPRSQLAMKGESSYKISKLMGNSPEICRRHYAALMPESLIDAVEFCRDRPPALASGGSHGIA